MSKDARAALKPENQQKTPNICVTSQKEYLVLSQYSRTKCQLWLKHIYMVKELSYAFKI